MAKKNKKKYNKVNKFLNKRTNDLTVKETLCYGAVATVFAMVVSVVPFAVLGYIENKETYTPTLNFSLPKAEEATEEIDEEAEEL